SKTDSGTSWFVLFRSGDPSIWNKEVNKGANTFARALDKVPEDIKYLKITEVKSKDFAIIEMTKDRISKVTDDGRYGFEGTGHLGSGGHHLGIYDLQMKTNKGEVCIRILPWQRGWGFGHLHFVNNAQGYCWAGKNVPATVFEIAVTAGPLTAVESKKLLKQ